MLLLFLVAAASDGGNGTKATVQDIAQQNETVVLALIAVISLAVGALVYAIKNNTLGKEIAKDASEANKAVNNVGPGEHRLYDKVTTLLADVKQIKATQARHQQNWDDFNAKWGNLPDDMDDGADLAVLLREMHHSIQTIDEKLDKHIMRTTGS